MALLIDTSVFITLERRGHDPEESRRLVPNEELSIAAMTAAELLTGVHRADTPDRRRKRDAFVEALLRLVPIVPFDLAAAPVHARLWADLATRGTPIGPHDLIVAVTALANGNGVLTENIDEFQRIPELLVLRPEWSS